MLRTSQGKLTTIAVTLGLVLTNPVAAGPLIYSDDPLLKDDDRLEAFLELRKIP